MIAECIDKPGPTLDQMIDFVVADFRRAARGSFLSLPLAGGWPAKAGRVGVATRSELASSVPVLPHPGLRFAVADAKHRRYLRNGGLKAAYATSPQGGGITIGLASITRMIQA